MEYTELKDGIKVKGKAGDWFIDTSQFLPEKVYSFCIEGCLLAVVKRVTGELHVYDLSKPPLSK